MLMNRTTLGKNTHIVTLYIIYGPAAAQIACMALMVTHALRWDKPEHSLTKEREKASLWQSSSIVLPYFTMEIKREQIDKDTDLDKGEVHWLQE